MKKIFFILLMLLWCSPLLAKGTSKKHHQHPKKVSPPVATGPMVLKPLWSKKLKSKTSKGYLEMSVPVLNGEDLYVGTQAGLLYRVNANQGEVLWQFASDGPINSSVTVNGAQVFFGDSKGYVYALDADSGSKKWDVFVGGEILAQPALSGQAVIVVTTSREVYSLSTETGAVQWVTYLKGFEKNITMRGNADMVINDGKIYLALADGQMAALSIQTGSVLWNKSFGGGDADFWDIDSTLVVQEGRIYSVGYFGQLFSLSASNAALLWKADVKSGSNLLVDDNHLYLTSSEGALLAYSKKEGSKIYGKPLYSGALSSPVSVKNNIVLGSENNGVFVCSKEGKVLQRLKGRRTFLSAGVSDHQRFYFLSTDGRLLAYSVLHQ